MTFTLGSETNRDRWTWSCWVKKCTNGETLDIMNIPQDDDNSQFFKFASDALRHDTVVGNATVGRLETNRKFRDPSAWYHLVIVWDSANATAGNRMRMYVNGVEETSFETDSNPSSGQDSWFYSGKVVNIGRDGRGTGLFDGYMAEIVFCDGQAYAASDFGEFNSDSPTIWQPKDVSELTFGNNGFWLDFEDSSALGNDVSGNNNDFGLTNLAAVDQATDSPTNNFATLNPLGLPVSNPATLSEGNCKIVLVGSSNADWGGGSTIGLSAGKWYWEVKPSNDISSSGSLIGVTDDPAEVARSSDQELTYTTPIGYGYKDNGNKRINLTGSEADTSYGDSYANDDIIGVALNMDDLELTFYKNGAVQNSGTAISMTASTHSGFYFPGTSKTGTATCTFEYNFGGCPAFALSSAANDGNGYGNFEYAPPSGFLAICTKNLGSDGG